MYSLLQTSQEHLISHVLPSLVRAYDDNDPRIQEEVLKKSAYLAKQLDVQVIILYLNWIPLFISHNN